MLPIVKGERNTVVQITGYAVLTCLATFAPYFLFPDVGWLYLASAGVLNAILMAYSLKLFRQVDRPRASALFHYSMLYLALLFVAFAVDRTVVMG
jgi:protoheme IX farnesyltransferase